MNGTGDKHLDNLMIAVTQQGVDDYKNILTHYARLKDSATVQVGKIERRLRGKMASIEDFFDRGDFCVLGEGAARRVCSELKKQLNFNDEKIVSDAEFCAAKTRLGSDLGYPLFFTADEVKARENRLAKNVRENTTRAIIGFLKKIYPQDRKVAEVCEKIEGKCLNKKQEYICACCKERTSEIVYMRVGRKRKMLCRECYEKEKNEGVSENACKKS